MSFAFPVLPHRASRQANARFSVIVPAHRAEDFLEETLLSVAAQGHAPWVVLVFEDGRLDDTAGLVESCRGRLPCPVRLLGAPAALGVSRARNALIEQVTTEYVAFLDADDLWAPDHLARAAEAFTQGADLVVSGLRWIDAAGRPMDVERVPAAEELADPVAALLRENFIQSSSVVCVRADVLRAAGPFDPALTHGEDLDLWLRILLGGAKLAYTGAVTVSYRRHPGSAMARTRAAIRGARDLRMKLSRDERIPRALREATLAEACWNHARFEWRSDPTAASESLRILAGLRPRDPKVAAARLLVAARRLMARSS